MNAEIRCAHFSLRSYVVSWAIVARVCTIWCEPSPHCGVITVRLGPYTQS